MKQQEKIIHLKTNHLHEWLTMRALVEDEYSQRQMIFCTCGKLATGLHERICRKFNKSVDDATVDKLKQYITIS